MCLSINTTNSQIKNKVLKKWCLILENISNKETLKLVRVPLPPWEDP